MKRVHIVLVAAVLIAIVAVIVLVINGGIFKGRAIKAGDVKSVEISSSLDGFMNTIKPIQTSDQEHIAILLECIKNVDGNNKHIISNVEIAPDHYEVKFEYKDGTSEIRKYTTYPSTEYQYPFTPFYKLFFPELYD